MLSTNFSQSQIMFQRHYGGSDHEGSSSILELTDGGYLIAGSTTSYGAGGQDGYVIKINESGDTLWTRTYGGSGNDQFNSIDKTLDNNYIIVGSTSSFGPNGYNMFVVKIDSLGDTIWQKTYGTIYDDGGEDVINTSDGGYIVVGGTVSGGAYSSVIYMYKLNSNGDSIWAQNYGKKTSNGAFQVLQTSNSGFIIIGSTSNGTINSRDVYLIKTNSIGDTIWTNTYGGNAVDWGYSVVISNDGFYYITGSTDSYGSGGSDVLIIKVDSNGTEQWLKTVGGTNDDVGGFIVNTVDNKLVITGRTESYGSGGNDLYLMKINETGDTIWTKTYGGNDNDWGGCVRQTADYGFIISGYTYSYGSNSDIYCVKTNQTGVAGIGEFQLFAPDIFIYPIPCNGNFTIEFTNQPNSAQISLYSIFGQRLYIRNYLTVQNAVVSIEIPEISNGNYFLHVDTDKYSYIRQLIINK